MKVLIPIKPLSVNAAWQGRRFKTKKYTHYCSDVGSYLSTKKLERVGGYVQINYKFWLEHWKRTDADNLVKCITDIIVANGLIDDDRFIMRYEIQKYPAKFDAIEIEVVPFDIKGVE